MVRDPTRRLVFGLIGAAAVVGAGIAVLDYFDPDLLAEDKRRTLGVFLLLGLPFFYLLTFVGEAEESEVEVAAWCAALALSVWLIKLTPTMPLLGVALPRPRRRPTPGRPANRDPARRSRPPARSRCRSGSRAAATGELLAGGDRHPRRAVRPGGRGTGAAARRIRLAGRRPVAPLRAA